jgi:hypothetical protein
MRKIESPLRFGLKTCSDLSELSPKTATLAEGLFEVGRPLLICGPTKSLKTKIAIDLGVSLASATPFLGTFGVVKERKVAIFSHAAEPALSNAIRTILAARKLGSAKSLSYASVLPSLATGEQCETYASALLGSGIEVVILDPLTLVLFDSVTEAQSAGNIFVVQLRLHQILRTLIAAGITPVIVHSTTKDHIYSPTSRAETTGWCPVPDSAWPHLGDITYTGIVDSVSQWLLLRRATAFCPATGIHHLLVGHGSNSGLGGQFQLRIKERTPDAESSDPTWLAEVIAPSSPKKQKRSKVTGTTTYCPHRMKGQPIDGSATASTD